MKKSIAENMAEKVAVNFTRTLPGTEFEVMLDRDVFIKKLTTIIALCIAEREAALNVAKSERYC